MTQNYVNNPLWADFKEELEYRIIRAQNEHIDDMDWFIECAMNELIPLAEKAVTFNKKDALLEWAKAKKQELLEDKPTDVAAGMNGAFDIMINKINSI